MRRPQARATDDRPADPSGVTDLPDEVFERIDALAAEFTERHRRGERPTIDEYAARHPDLGPSIRALFPALVMVEGLKPDSEPTVCRRGGPDAWSDEVAPDRLGDFRILREVGRGGMGVVYEAEQESLGRRVALKVLAPWACASEAMVRRFHREARSAAGLHHTNIVPVFGVGEHGGRHFYIMQFIHGAGLHQVLDELRRLDEGDPGPEGGSAAGPDDETAVAGAAWPLLAGGPSPVVASTPARPGAGGAGGPARPTSSSAADSRRTFMRRVARIGLQVAEALAKAHEQGVLHRDIKPSNVLLDGHGHAWVTDFGLAKAVDDEDLTHTGDLVGTIRYMAPERFRGECDGRSDLYALGLTLYEILARQPAFLAPDRHALMRKIVQEDPPRLEDLEAGIPRDLATIVHKAIEKAPADRYRSAAAMAADLRRFLDDRTIEARRVGPAERLLRWSRRNPALAGLTTAVAVLLVALTAISTAAAVRLDERRFEVERRLWEAYLANARASRRLDSEGRRFDALDSIAEAARLGIHADRRDELRDEVIACLALADLRRSGERTLASPSSRDHLLAFAPDGARLAEGVPGGIVRLHAADGPSALPTLIGPGPDATLLHFSDDGRRLAVRFGLDAECTFRVFDVDSGALLLDEDILLTGAAVAFDRDGERLAIGLDDGTIRIHDLGGRGEPALLSGPPEPVFMRFDDAGRRLAVSRYEHEDAVIVLDLDRPGPPRRWSLPGGALGLAWSPDGGRLAVGGGFRDLFLIDPDRPDAPPRVLSGHNGAIVSVDYARRGHLLASASWDGTVRLWHPESGETLVSASSPDHWTVRFGPGDRTLTGGRDGASYWRWEVADGDELRSRHVDHYPHTQTWSVDFFPDRSLFASAGSAGVRVFDAELRQVAFLPLPGDTTAEVMPDGKSLLTGGSAGIRRRPILREGDELRIGDPEPFGPVQDRPIGRIRVDARGRRVAAVVGPEPRMVVLFDADGAGQPSWFCNHRGLERIDMSPDGRLVASGTWKGTGVKIWDAETGQHLADLEVDGSAEVAFSPDGRTLVTGSGQEYACWEVGSWRRRWTLDRHQASNQPGKIAFAADGVLAAVAWSRTMARLIDARTGAVVATFEAPTPDYLAELGLDGERGFLFVKDHGGGTRRWDLRAIRRRLDAMGVGWSELPQAGPAATPDLSAGVVARQAP